MSADRDRETRLSPDGELVAIRRGPNDWRVSNGGHYRDVHVAYWTRLVRAVREHDALRRDLAALAERAERHGYLIDPDDVTALLDGGEGGR